MNDDNSTDLHPADVQELRQLVTETIPVSPLISTLDIRRYRSTIDRHKRRVMAENHRRQAGEHFAFMAGALAKFPGEKFIKLLEIRLDEAGELLEEVRKLTRVELS
jgi:hypothetical protein